MTAGDMIDYEVTFAISAIDADSPRAAAELVAHILADEGYAHRAVYQVHGNDGTMTEVDLGDEDELTSSAS